MRRRLDARERRKLSVRKRVHGSTQRPRLCVFRSAKHIYAQVINDTESKTLVSSSTLDPEIQASLAGLKKKDHAKLIGKEIAKKCLGQGITEVVFDRSGFIYHGRVSSLADGAREAGLRF